MSITVDGSDGGVVDVNPAECTRDEVHVGDDEYRFYEHDALDQPLVSVTSIINTRVDPEKDDALSGWRDFYDASAKHRAPHWRDQQVYKQKRGTLGHYSILSQLAAIEADTYYHDLGDDDKGFEEYEAEYVIQEWATQRPAVKEGYPVFGPEHEYDGAPAWDRCMRELNWCIKTFQKEVVPTHQISPETVLDVERYVVEPEWHYAGQFDLLYESGGETVLADLKLSKLKDEDVGDVKRDYKLQLAAYAYAVDEHVDRLQSIQLSPDTQNWQVVDNEDWGRSVAGLIHEFLGLADETHHTLLDHPDSPLNDA